MNTLLATGDLNGDGFPDLVISGRHGNMAWLENPGVSTPSGNWRKHIVDHRVSNMECGGLCYPVRGKPGFEDIVNGNEAGGDSIFWWENPGTDSLWKKHLIAKTGFKQIHDTAIGTIGDDQPRLFFTNQKGENGGRLWSVPLPEDPTVSPWPDIEPVADNLWEPNPHNPRGFPGGRQPAEGIAIGDLDGDGANEIILSEGDAVIYGFPRGCKCAWFNQSDAD